MEKQKTRQKISKTFGFSFGKPKPIFSETEIKAFKSLALLALAMVALACTATLAVVAPNLIGAIGKMATSRFKGSNLIKKEKSKKSVEVFYYLKKSGLIKVKKTPTEIWLSLTGKGKQRLKNLKFDILRIKPQAKWDKKWWLVAADIPTKNYKTAADLFRKKLKEMGFWSLQRTLWLYPFDPRDEVQFIAKHYGIQNFITAMEVSRLDSEDEKALKNHFISIGVLK